MRNKLKIIMVFALMIIIGLGVKLHIKSNIPIETYCPSHDELVLQLDQIEGIGGVLSDRIATQIAPTIKDINLRNEDKIKAQMNSINNISNGIIILVIILGTCIILIVILSTNTNLLKSLRDVKEIVMRFGGKIK